MAMSLFSPKVFCAEVTGGVDLESRVLLTGSRVTIGTSPRDTLTLGAQHVVAGHLTFQRTKGGKSWEYFSSDSGATAVDRGNPRTGTVRAGMWFNLGGGAKIEITRVPAPEDLADEAPDGEKKTVPLAVALPAMAGMVGVALIVVGASGGGARNNADLLTTRWYSGAEPLEPALDTCIASGLSPEARALSASPDDADALFRAAVSGAPQAIANLSGEVRAIIAESHLLASENKALDASAALRRLENVLPVGNADCPILSAARVDLAILEMQGSRR